MKIPISSNITINQALNGGGGKTNLFTNLTLDEFLIISGVKVSILNQYTTALEKKNAEDLFNSGETVIKRGTVLEIDSQFLNRNVLYKFNRNTVKTTSFPFFISAALEELLNDPNYKTRIQNNSDNLSIDNSFGSVVIWSKAINNWINVTPFITSVETSVTFDGGSFSFNLAETKGELFNIWRQSQITQNSELAVLFSEQRDSSFFKNILQENDVVFIRLTHLENELDFSFSTEISSDQVAGKNYDLIGLVDAVNAAYSSGSNDYSISVSGRDMLKLLQEDGTYFFPGATSNRAVFVNEPEGSLNSRTNLGIASASNFSYQFNTIEEVLKFIVAKYSNVGLIPYDISDTSRGSRPFYGWGSRLSSTFTESPVNGLISPNQRPAAGVWSLIDFLFDNTVRQRRLTDNGLSSDHGPIISSIKKICQEPFVEFFGDTYKDKYVFTVRKPPFDKQSVLSYLNQSVNSIGVTNSIFSNININPSSAIVANRFSRSNLVLTVKEKDVVSENLTFSNDSYSWYRVKLSATTGSPQDLTIAPPVSFERAAQQFGVKAFTSEIQYLNNFTGVQDNQSTFNQLNLQRQIVEELKFCIQSFGHLPFTRSGTVSIELNRTFKRGTYIYYEPSNEIFYLDAVTHLTQVDRGSVNGDTQLILSRGMKADHIFDRTDGNSYFNLYDLNTPVSFETARQAISSWTTNNAVWDYFTQRRQFS